MQLVENIIETIDRLRTSLGEVVCTEIPIDKIGNLTNAAILRVISRPQPIVLGDVSLCPLEEVDDGAGKNLLSLRGLD